MKKDWSKCTEEELQVMPFMRAQIVRIMQILNLSGAEFARLCKRTPNYVTSVTGEIDSGTMRSLKESLPNLNLEWFITGKGTMFLDQFESKDSNDSSIIYPKNECPLPIYNDLFQKYSEILVKCAKLEYENNKLREQLGI